MSVDIKVHHSGKYTCHLDDFYETHNCGHILVKDSWRLFHANPIDDSVADQKLRTDRQTDRRMALRLWPLHQVFLLFRQEHLNIGILTLTLFIPRIPLEFNCIYNTKKCTLHIYVSYSVNISVTCFGVICVILRKPTPRFKTYNNIIYYKSN